MRGLSETLVVLETWERQALPLRLRGTCAHCFLPVFTAGVTGSILWDNGEMAVGCQCWKRPSFLLGR